jgi:hypothetical protein
MTSWVNAILQASSLALSLRMIAPVLAESFINLLLFILARPEVKADSRFYETVLRSQVDVRVRGLHLYCMNFDSPVDTSVKPFQNFHSLMNRRNDLLHGNIEPLQLMFEEVFFDQGTIPLFKHNDPLPFRVTRNLVKHVEPIEAQHDYEVVEAFIEHVLSFINPDVREQLKRLMEEEHLGWRPETGRVGVLFGQTVPFGYAVIADDHEHDDKAGSSE